MTRWNFESLEDAARFLHSRGKEVSQIALDLSQSEQFIEKALSTDGEDDSRLSSLSDGELAKLYRWGASIMELAELTGSSYHVTRNRLLDFGVQMRRPGQYQPHPTPSLKELDSTTYDSLPEVVVALFFAGLDIAGIKSATGLSHHEITIYLTEDGIKWRKRKMNVSPKALISTYRQTKSAQSTGLVLGINETTVISLLREQGEPIGQRGGRSRESRQDVAPIHVAVQTTPEEKQHREIVARFEKGHGTQRIVDELGVPLSVVNDSIRTHRARGGTEGEIIRRSANERPAVIAASLGLRTDRVRAVIENYRARLRRSGNGQ